MVSSTTLLLGVLKLRCSSLTYRQVCFVEVAAAAVLVHLHHIS